MEVDKLDDLELYQDAFEIQQIGNDAIERVIKENKEKKKLEKNQWLKIKTFFKGFIK